MKTRKLPCEIAMMLAASRPKGKDLPGCCAFLKPTSGIERRRNPFAYSEAMLERSIFERSQGNNYAMREGTLGALKMTSACYPN